MVGMTADAFPVFSQLRRRIRYRFRGAGLVAFSPKEFFHSDSRTVYASGPICTFSPIRNVPRSEVSALLPQPQRSEAHRLVETIIHFRELTNRILVFYVPVRQ